MHNSTLTAILIGTCAFVSSQVSSATNGRTQHSFECRLISGGYPYNEIAQYGYFQGGTFINGSGSSAYVICPLTIEYGDNYFSLNTSQNVTSCSLAKTLTNGSTTYLPPSTQHQGYFNWYPVTADLSFSLEIQCSVPANGAIYMISGSAAQ